ncbi:MAG: hypothetical protein RR182_00015 [Alistipes sp.]
MENERLRNEQAILQAKMNARDEIASKEEALKAQEAKLREMKGDVDAASKVQAQQFKVEQELNQAKLDHQNQQAELAMERTKDEAVRKAREEVQTAKSQGSSALSPALEFQMTNAIKSLHKIASVPMPFEPPLLCKYAATNSTGQDISIKPIQSPSPVKQTGVTPNAGAPAKSPTGSNFNIPSTTGAPVRINRTITPVNVSPVTPTDMAGSFKPMGEQAGANSPTKALASMAPAPSMQAPAQTFQTQPQPQPQPQPQQQQQQQSPPMFSQGGALNAYSKVKYDPYDDRAKQELISGYVTPDGFMREISGTDALRNVRIATNQARSGKDAYGEPLDDRQAELNLMHAKNMARKEVENITRSGRAKVESGLHDELIDLSNSYNKARASGDTQGAQTALQSYTEARRKYDYIKSREGSAAYARRAAELYTGGDGEEVDRMNNYVQHSGDLAQKDAYGEMNSQMEDYIRQTQGEEVIQNYKANNIINRKGYKQSERDYAEGNKGIGEGLLDSVMTLPRMSDNYSQGRDLTHGMYAFDPLQDEQQAARSLGGDYTLANGAHIPGATDEQNEAFRNRMESIGGNRSRFSTTVAPTLITGADALTIPAIAAGGLGGVAAKGALKVGLPGVAKAIQGFNTAKTGVIGRIPLVRPATTGWGKTGQIAGGLAGWTGLGVAGATPNEGQDLDWVKQVQMQEAEANGTPMPDYVPGRLNTLSAFDHLDKTTQDTLRTRANGEPELKQAQAQPAPQQPLPQPAPIQQPQPLPQPAQQPPAVTIPSMIDLASGKMRKVQKPTYDMGEAFSRGDAPTPTQQSELGDRFAGNAKNRYKQPMKQTSNFEVENHDYEKDLAGQQPGSKSPIQSSGISSGAGRVGGMWENLAWKTGVPLLGGMLGVPDPLGMGIPDLSGTDAPVDPAKALTTDKMRESLFKYLTSGELRQAPDNMQSTMQQGMGVVPQTVTPSIKMARLLFPTH